jgi:hypothetical protein
MQRLLPAPVAPLRFLGLLPSAPMDMPMVPHTRRVVASGQGGPAPAAPGAVKPQIAIDFEDAQAFPTTVAGYTQLTRQALFDVSQLGTFVQTTLLGFAGNVSASRGRCVTSERRQVGDPSGVAVDASPLFARVKAAGARLLRQVQASRV